MQVKNEHDPVKSGHLYLYNELHVTYLQDNFSNGGVDKMRQFLLVYRLVDLILAIRFFAANLFRQATTLISEQVRNPNVFCRQVM